ncbi:proteasome regulatory particle base subunit, partial [Coemansia aciculifera]
LTSSDGQLNMAACAGMLLFTQFWYWFPLAHFLALTFKPTALIAVNKDLKLPKLDATCLSRKALFAYPAAIVPPTVVAPTKIATAVLSTTAKARRGVGGAKKGEDSVMEVEPPVAPAPAVEEGGMDVDESSDGKGGGASKKGRKGGAEAPFAVGNMTRLLPYQERFVKWSAGSRYVAVKQGTISGILLVKDTTPEKAEELVVSALADDPEDDDDDDEDDDEEEDADDEEMVVTGNSEGGAPAAAASSAAPDAFEYPFNND